MTDGVRKIDMLRSFYKAQMRPASSDTNRELGEIKSELQIANDLKVDEMETKTTATHSPYLPDQPYYKKEVVYNSAEETDWKKVRSEEENRREALIFRNLRRLNIL